MGDPETQPIMMRLKTDLADLIEAAIAGKLDQTEAEWDRRFALGVVLAAQATRRARARATSSPGCPPPSRRTCGVFHAGTALQDSQVVTAGGRVLCVTALGDNVRSAQKRAYEVADGIVFEGRQYRRDTPRDRPQDRLIAGRRAGAHRRLRPASDGVAHQRRRPRAKLSRGAGAPMPRRSRMDPRSVKPWFHRELQRHIVERLEAFDGQAFRSDGWDRLAQAVAASPE